MLRSIRITPLCAALLLAACSTPSSHTAVPTEAEGEMVASQSEGASAPATAAVEQEDPIVCKRVVKTGTRVAQRLCMRRSQQEAHKRGAQEMLGEVQKRGALSTQSQQ